MLKIKPFYCLATNLLNCRQLLVQFTNRRHLIKFAVVADPLSKQEKRQATQESILNPSIKRFHFKIWKFKIIRVRENKMPPFWKSVGCNQVGKFSLEATRRGDGFKQSIVPPTLSPSELEIPRKVFLSVKISYKD